MNKKEIFRKIDKNIILFGETIYSIIRILIGFNLNLRTKFNKQNMECIIVGNGPSTKEFINNFKAFCSDKDVYCVNYFAENEIFFIIKPDAYVLLDPSFWLDGVSIEKKEKRDNLYKILLKSTDWPINIYLPFDAKKYVSNKSKNDNVKISFFNRTPVRGFMAFREWCYKFNLGMPTAGNVLVAAIFLTIKCQYKTVFVVGADHSWHKEIMVGDDNILYVRQVHFYDDNKVDLVPFNKTNSDGVFNISGIFHEWSEVYKSYDQLREFSKKNKVRVVNTTKNSFIDSFERMPNLWKI